jgi:dolichyl-phosphate beta-glucosyltransferase
MHSINISIIIPAYNEEARLPLFLGSIAAYFEPQDISYEIIIVDDGSTDSTAGVVERLAADNPSIKLIRLAANRGKGCAVRTGMLQARGKLLLFTDADGATPIAEFQRLKDAVKKGADLAIASRALRDDSCVVVARLHRKVIGTVFNLIVSVVAIQGVKDTQCGFKLFTAESAASIFPLQRIDGFGFDVEILFISNKLGHRIVEVPVSWTDIKGSKVMLMRDSVKMFADIFRTRLNNLRGYYR